MISIKSSGKGHITITIGGIIEIFTYINKEKERIQIMTATTTGGNGIGRMFISNTIKWFKIESQTFKKYENKYLRYISTIEEIREKIKNTMTMKKNIAKQMNISVNRLSQILNYKREAKGHEII